MLWIYSRGVFGVRKGNEAPSFGYCGNVFLFQTFRDFWSWLQYGTIETGKNQRENLAKLSIEHLHPFLMIIMPSKKKNLSHWKCCNIVNNRWFPLLAFLFVMLSHFLLKTRLFLACCCIKARKIYNSERWRRKIFHHCPVGNVYLLRTWIFVDVFIIKLQSWGKRRFDLKTCNFEIFQNVEMMDTTFC